MSLVNLIITRGISTTAVRNGKKNFRKFPIYNKRGTRQFKKEQATDPDPDFPIDKRGVRDVGFEVDKKFFLIPEKVPELIVPDLKDFELKPYVSYKADDVVQSEFTAEDLFNVIYAPKIAKDFKEGKLDAEGNPLEPSPEEKLTAQEAFNNARKTGSDIF